MFKNDDQDSRVVDLAPMKSVKETLHVVPKKDVDKMLDQMYFSLHILRTDPIAQKLRGIVYANTFLATREIITEETP